jgi:hypothetical protein
MPLKTRRISLIVTFTAASIVLDSITTPGFSSGIWYGWVFLLSPTNGILLGPFDGFITTLLSVFIGHTLVFRESIYEYIFTLGSPIASLATGLLYRGRRKGILIYYLALLGAYFLTPISRRLPVWGMWDVYLAFITLLLWSILYKYKMNLLERQEVVLALTAFIGLEADILFRIFLLVPARGYSIFYGLSPEVLAAIWAVPAPLITPIKVAIAVFLTVILVTKISNVFDFNSPVYSF